MNTDSSLVNELRKKEYRDAYVASQIRIGLPFQIRALRNQRGWSQSELASRAGMAQPRIAEMEKPGERRFTLETLLRTASAFDVALQIRFVPFGELVEWSEDFSQDDFIVLSFNDEIVEREKNTTTVVVPAPSITFRTSTAIISGGIPTALEEKALGKDRRQSENQKSEHLKELLTSDNRKGVILPLPYTRTQMKHYERGDMSNATPSSLAR